MRLITAIIESYKVEDVRAALAAIGVHRMTATEVEGCGRQTGRSELDRGVGYVVDLLPKAKIEIAVAAGTPSASCKPSSRPHAPARSARSSSRGGRMRCAGAPARPAGAPPDVRRARCDNNRRNAQ